MAAKAEIVFRPLAGGKVGEKLLIEMRNRIRVHRGEQSAAIFTAQSWRKMSRTPRAIVALHQDSEIGFLHFHVEGANNILDIGFVLPEYANQDVEDELVRQAIGAGPPNIRLVFSGPLSSWADSLGVDNFSLALSKRGFSLFFYLVLCANFGESAIPQAPDFTTPGIKIESFTDEHLDICAEIMAAAPDEAIRLLHYTGADCGRWILFPQTKRPADHPPDLSFVAVAGGYPVGFIACRVHESGSAWLGQLFILPEYQGQGVGKTLLTHTLHGCRNRGLSQVCLAVSENNAPALGLYRRFGFTEIARLPRWYKILT